MSIIDKLMVKPWIADQGALEEQNGFAQPAKKIALWIFLAVVSVLFSLFISAYFMRMELADGRPLADPGLLWINTALLIVSSVALQWARVSADRGQFSGLKFGLLIAGAATLAFLAGQYVAWQQLIALGYFASSNPANAFYYLLTGLHGLHLLGGLVVWGMTTNKLMGGSQVDEVRVTVELCAIYWHFLLLVWLILFGLLLST